MRTIAALFLLSSLVASAQQPMPAPSKEVVQAIDLLSANKAGEAAKILEAQMMSAPSEEVYFYLGNAYWASHDLNKAGAAYEDGLAKFPLSARLANAAARVAEEKFDVPHAIQLYRRAVALDPQIAYLGGGRYDPQEDAIYIPVVHDHRGANACLGRLYVNGTGIHYVVYEVWSGYGPGNDDSFKTPFSNITARDVDRKKGENQFADYRFLANLSGMSGPRRRIASGEDNRVDIKFYFKDPIAGYRGKPWTKADIKFFFVEPEIGERFLKYLDAKAGTKDGAAPK